MLSTQGKDSEHPFPEDTLLQGEDLCLWAQSLTVRMCKFSVASLSGPDKYTLWLWTKS